MSIPKKPKRYTKTIEKITKPQAKRIKASLKGAGEYVSERVTARISKPLAPTPKPINLNKRHNKSK